MRYLLLIFIFLAFQSQAQDQNYLFSYFTGNGQDGLHLAYSMDGLTWEALNNGKPIAAPKGKAFYMFLKNENSNPPAKNIRMTRSKHAAGPYPVEVSAPITGKYI